MRQLSGDLQHLWMRLGELEYRGLELVTGKRPRAVKNSSIKILIEANFSSFQRGDQHFVSILELLFIEMKLLRGLFALGTIPGVGEQHAADIPKNGADLRQASPPVRLMMVHAGVHMVIAPIKPIVFQRGDTLQASAESGTVGGTALEVPFAACRAVYKFPGCGIAFAKKLHVRPV